MGKNKNTKSTALMKPLPPLPVVAAATTMLDEICRRLNALLALDDGAVTRLVLTKQPANLLISQRVTADRKTGEVNALGLLNSLFAAPDDALALRICAAVRDDGVVERFFVTRIDALPSDRFLAEREESGALDFECWLPPSGKRPPKLPGRVS